MNIGNFYEQCIQIKFESGLPGFQKVDRKLSDAGAEALGMDKHMTQGMVNLVEPSVTARLRAIQARGRGYIKSNCWVWSDSKISERGYKESGVQYVTMRSKLPDIEVKMRGLRKEFEQACESQLLSQWPRIRAEGAIKLAGRHQEHYNQSTQEIRDQCRWECEIVALPYMEEGHDMLDEAMQNLMRDQKQRVTNVLNSVAERMQGEVTDIIQRMDDYQFTPGDNRTGNTLPKEKGIKRLGRMADDAMHLCDALQNEGLKDGAEKIRKLIDHMKELGDGDLRDARSALSGEDDSMREEVKKQLNEIKDSVDTGVEALDKFMS